MVFLRYPENLGGKCSLLVSSKMLSGVLCLLSSGLIPQASRSLGNESRSVWWNPGSQHSAPPDDFVIFQGDILLPANQNSRNAIKLKQYLWANGTIPYEYGDDFSSSEKELISDAMSTLQSKSCIRFVEKAEDDETFISFQKKNAGCYAPIGRLPANSGRLPVNLQSPECFKERGIIEHELLHVIGLFHEQARPDRDEFVTVHWCNINPQQESNFIKASDVIVDSFGLPYDFSSIMHYPSLAFSKNGQPTITAKSDPKMPLGQRKSPTDLDFQKVAKMYDCKEFL